MTLHAMIETHPRQPTADRATLLRCIEELFGCAAACTGCVDACLGVENVTELAACILLNLDCADICSATARILTRQVYANQAVLRTAVEACGQACQSSAAECKRHAEHHRHCRLCADVCRRCEEACADLLANVG
jgi:hypothetical protein